MTGTNITPTTVVPNSAYASGESPMKSLVNAKFNAIAIAADM